MMPPHTHQKLIMPRRRAAFCAKLSSMKGKGYQGFRVSISASSASAIINSGNGLPGRDCPLACAWRGLRARLNMANFAKIEDRECGFSKLKRWSQGLPS